MTHQGKYDRKIRDFVAKKLKYTGKEFKEAYDELQKAFPADEIEAELKEANDAFNAELNEKNEKEEEITKLKKDIKWLNFDKENLQREKEQNSINEIQAVNNLLEQRQKSKKMVQKMVDDRKKLEEAVKQRDKKLSAEWDDKSNQYESRYSKLSTKHARTENEFEKVKTELGNLKSQLANEAKEKADALKELKDLKTKWVQQSKEKSELSKELKKAKEEQANYVKKLTKESEAKEAVTKTLNAFTMGNVVLNIENKALKADLNSSDSQIKALNGENARKTLDINKLDSKLYKSSKVVQNKTEEVKEMRRSNRKLEDEKVHLVEALMGKHDEFKLKFERKDSQIEALSTTKNALEEEVAQQKAQIESLEDSKLELDSIMGTLRSLVGDKNTSVEEAAMPPPPSVREPKLSAEKLVTPPPKPAFIPGTARDKVNDHDDKSDQLKQMETEDSVPEGGVSEGAAPDHVQRLKIEDKSGAKNGDEFKCKDNKQMAQMGTEASSPSKHTNKEKDIPKFRKPAPKSVQEKRAKRKLQSPTKTSSKKLKTEGPSTDKVEKQAKEGSGKRKAPPETELSPRREQKAPRPCELIGVSMKGLEANEKSTAPNKNVQHPELELKPSPAPGQSKEITDRPEKQVVSYYI